MTDEEIIRNVAILLIGILGGISAIGWLVAMIVWFIGIVFS